MYSWHVLKVKAYLMIFIAPFIQLLQPATGSYNYIIIFRPKQEMKFLLLTLEIVLKYSLVTIPTKAPTVLNLVAY